MFEDVIWINQKLLSHKDLEFDTKTILEVSITCNTRDYVDFSNPTLNVSIISDSQKDRKVYSLSYIDCTDIIRFIETEFKKNSLDTMYSNNIEFVKTSKNKLFKIHFKQSPSGNRGIIIGVSYTSTEYYYTAVRENIFDAFLNIIRNFIRDYIKISCDFSSRELIGHCLKELKGVRSAITTLPSHLVSSDISNQKITEDIIKEDNMSLENDLKEFLGGNEMNNIKIEDVKSGVGELLEDKENVQEIKSNFVSKVLEGDIKNINDIIQSVSILDNPMISFLNRIVMGLEMSYKELLPNIIDRDLKSASYVSKLVYNHSTKNFIVNRTRMNSSIPIIFYNETDNNEKLQDLMYDIFLISIYVKKMKDKLSTVFENDMENKNDLYLGIRCFSDIFVFSRIFGSNIDPIVFENNVLSRFKYYSHIGFFISFEKELDIKGLKTITEYELKEIIQQIFSIKSSLPTIDQLHNYYTTTGSFILPVDNEFSLEQILNEVIILEVNSKVYGSIQTIDDIKKYINEPDEKICNLFLKKKESIKEIKSKQSNISRIINSFRNEIPEEHIDEFLKVIDTLSDQAFDFEKNKNLFKWEKFGHNVIKCLYVWDPVKNENLKNSYKDLFIRVEDSMLDVDIFLSTLYSKDETKKEEDNEESQYNKWI